MSGCLDGSSRRSSVIDALHRARAMLGIVPVPIHTGSGIHKECKEERRGVTGYGKIFDWLDDTVERAKTEEQQEKQPR